MPELRWTNERPTKPGWYWYRDARFSDHPRAYYVREDGTIAHPDDAEAHVNELSGEWAGPADSPA